MDDGRKVNNNLNGELWGDDSLLLVEKVLKHIRNGGKLVDAFREMEEETDGRRTVRACKYHWHAKLYEQYKAGFELAKEEGKKAKEIKNVNSGKRQEVIFESVLGKSDVEVEIQIEDVISLAQAYKKQQEEKVNDTDKLTKELDKLKRENANLKKEVKKLNSELDDSYSALASRNRDYTKVIEALETLKSLGVQINIPEPEKNEYVIGKDGTVSKK